MKIVDRSNMKVFLVSVLVIAVLAPLAKTQSNLIQVRYKFLLICWLIFF